MRRSATRFTAVVLAMLSGCDRLLALRSGSARAPSSSSAPAPIERVSVGDRSLVIRVESRAWSEGVLASGGHAPAFQRPGQKRRITVSVSGAVGRNAPASLADVSSLAAWDRDLSSAARAEMDASNAVIERCSDPSTPERVAFRARTRAGGALAGGDLRWIGAFLLPNTVSIARNKVEGAHCSDALAALPANAEAWVRAELAAARDDTWSADRVVRRRVALRDPSAVGVVDDPPSGPRSADTAGLVAVSERIALDAALDWALASSDPLPQAVYSALGAQLERDAALAARALDALDPANTALRLGSMRAPVAGMLASIQPSIALERAEALATHLVAACSDAARAPSLCTPTRVDAVARVAARAELRAGCTAIAAATTAMATALAEGEDRARARLVALQAVHRCAEPAALRAASLALLGGPYDPVGDSMTETTCFSDSEAVREGCTDPALYAAVRLRAACGDDVLQALYAAAPRATQYHQQRAALCLARACGGASAAQRAYSLFPEGSSRDRLAVPTSDCWAGARGASRD